jgi:hypothetical protein
MATYQHGIITTESGSYGLYTDVTADYGQEKAEARDANGDVIQTTGFNPTIDVKINCIFDTSKALPALNSTVTLSGGKTTGAFSVEHMSISEKNTEYCTFSLDLKRWVANSLPAS